MESLVQKIANLANITFSISETDDSFSKHLSDLVNMINELKVSDLNINTSDMIAECSGSFEKDSKPVICTLIKRNELFSMGMFLLQEGTKIPLHDHPDMYGIIKVILGTVKITSYTRLPEPTNGENFAENGEDVSQPDSLIPVELFMSSNVTSNDEPAVLTPTTGNYHEIEAVGDIAVIFDIISPNYDFVNRSCHYYNVIESESSDGNHKTWLCEIFDPPYYWTKDATYTGPEISG